MRIPFVSDNIFVIKPTKRISNLKRKKIVLLKIENENENSSHDDAPEKIGG